MSATYRCHCRPMSRRLARGEVDFSIHFAPEFIIPLDVGKPITIIGGVHVGCYELFANERNPQHRRPEGQECRRAGPSSSGPHLFLASMAGLCRARPCQGHQLGDERYGQADGTFQRRQDRCVSRLSARATGAARPKLGHVIVDSSVDRPWSQYFCCVLAGNARFRRATTRSRRSACCAPSSRQPTSASPSRSGWRSVWSMAGSPLGYDYALQALSDDPVRPMAGVRPRGHDPVLRAAAARGRHDQHPPPTRSSPRAPTGASSTSSSAS